MKQLELIKLRVLHRSILRSRVRTNGKKRAVKNHMKEHHHLKMAGNKAIVAATIMRVPTGTETELIKDTISLITTTRTLSVVVDLAVGVEVVAHRISESSLTARLLTLARHLRLVWLRLSQKLKPKMSR